MDVDDWATGEARRVDYFVAVPRQIVSDNPKSGLTRACFYVPAVNRSYANMWAHHGTVSMLVRPYKPQDEAGV
jgi:transposase